MGWGDAVTGLFANATSGGIYRSKVVAVVRMGRTGFCSFARGRSFGIADLHNDREMLIVYAAYHIGSITAERARGLFYYAFRTEVLASC